MSKEVSCEVAVTFEYEADLVKKVVLYLTPANVNEQDMNKRTQYTLTKDESTNKFNGVINNLDHNTRYYVAIYYEYLGHFIHETNTEFSTKRIPQAGDNVSPGKKDE